MNFFDPRALWDRGHVGPVGPKLQIESENEFLGPVGPGQGAQNYLPPPPESKIELWVTKSTVDTQILENTGKSYPP